MIGRMQLACNSASSVVWQDVARTSKVARVVMGVVMRNFGILNYYTLSMHIPLQFPMKFSRQKQKIFP